MAPILLAGFGGLMVSMVLEIRIRDVPKLGPAWRSVRTSSALTGMLLLLTALIILEWKDPLWLHAATIASAAIGMVLGNYYGQREATSAQAQGALSSPKGQSIARQMGAFALAFTAGSIAFGAGTLIWTGRPGPLGTTMLTIVGASLGAVLAVRQAAPVERT